MYMGMGEEKNTRIVIRATREQRETLSRMAKLTGQTLSNYVRKAIGLPTEQKGERKDLKKS